MLAARVMPRQKGMTLNPKLVHMDTAMGSTMMMAVEFVIN